MELKYNVHRYIGTFGTSVDYTGTRAPCKNLSAKGRLGVGD